MKKSYAAMLLLTLAACTQAQAPVINAGNQSYTRPGDGYHSNSRYYNGSSAAVQDAYVAPVTVSNNAGVSSGGIQVNDLSSPIQNSASPAHSAPAGSPFGSGTPAPAETTPTDSHNPMVDEPVTTHSAAAGGEFIWPVSGKKVVSSFGSKGAGKVNEGINIAAENGEPVWAAADGEVVYADNSLKGYGNMVLVKHKGGKTTTYAHLSRKVVEKYDRVKQGDIIGYVGQSGNVKTPQLFFGVREGTTAVDPQKYVK